MRYAHFKPFFSKANLNTLIAKCTSSFVMHIGGLMRNMLPVNPPLPNNNFMSLQSSQMSSILSAGNGVLLSLSVTISTPIINPFPRTSPIL